MNKKETKKVIEVMQAYVDGKEIEILSEKDTWTTVENPSWIDKVGYRIKPKPREFEIMVMGDGLIRDAAYIGGYVGEVIKVREVL